MGKFKVVCVSSPEAAATVHSVAHVSDLDVVPPRKIVTDIGPHRFVVHSGTEGPVFDAPIGSHILFYPLVFYCKAMPKLTESRLRKLIVEAALRSTEEEEEPDEIDDDPPAPAAAAAVASDFEEEPDDEPYFSQDDSDEESDDDEELSESDDEDYDE